MIDNLDKAWDKQSDIPSLTEFLLGLLKAASRISNDFRSVAATQQSVNVSLAVFIRADIFYRVMTIARERDKIPYSSLAWTDPEQLIRVLEERMEVSRSSVERPKTNLGAILRQGSEGTTGKAISFVENNASTT